MKLLQGIKWVLLALTIVPILIILTIVYIFLQFTEDKGEISY